jgi:hypothetical protein
MAEAEYWRFTVARDCQKKNTSETHSGYRQAATLALNRGQIMRSFLALLLAAPGTAAEISLPTFMTSNMVLQMAPMSNVVVVAEPPMKTDDNALALPAAWLNAYEASSMVVGIGTQSWLPGPPVGNTGQYITNSALPSIGNGYLGTQWLSPVLYISGLFSGSPAAASQPGGTAVHRAALPSTASVTVKGATPVVTALDFGTAVVEQRMSVPAQPGLSVAHRAFAHRRRKELLVVEFNVSGTPTQPLALSDEAFEAMVTGKVPSGGWGNPAVPDFKLVAAMSTQLKDAQVVTAQLTSSSAETGNLTRAVICRDAVPPTITTGVTRLLAAHVVGGNDTSLSALTTRACDLLAAARKEAAAELLLTAHRKAWLRLWQSGVQISGASFHMQTSGKDIVHGATCC